MFHGKSRWKTRPSENQDIHLQDLCSVYQLIWDVRSVCVCLCAHPALLFCCFISCVTYTLFLWHKHRADGILCLEDTIQPSWSSKWLIPRSLSVHLVLESLALILDPQSEHVLSMESLVSLTAFLWLLPWIINHLLAFDFVLSPDHSYNKSKASEARGRHKYEPTISRTPSQKSMFL